jgi:hypothetical protein
MPPKTQVWNLASPLPTTRFYVYQLSDELDCPFYIGKGQGQRVHEHEREARLGCDCPRCDVIHAVWARGAAVNVSVLYATNDERDAYAHEARLIDVAGLEKLTYKRPGVAYGRTSIPPPSARVTLSLDDQLWREFRAACIKRGKSASAVVEMGMHEQMLNWAAEVTGVIEDSGTQSNTKTYDEQDMGGDIPQ